MGRMYIRMLMSMSGSRHDNQDWPPYGECIDVPEWEGEQLIRGGNAELADEEFLDRGYEVLRVPDPNYEDRLREGYNEDEEEDEDLSREGEEKEEIDYDADFERDDSENVVEQVVVKPKTVANKDVWIEYAVFKGGDRKQVAELTKAQIISKYGA